MSQHLAEGRYQLERPLGEGGTATVWLATDTALGAQRAIKLMHGAKGSGSALQKRLVAEARAMARLDAHPYILRVIDIGTEDDQIFVVMELATGGSLADGLETTGPLGLPEALGYALQVLAALSAAHALGIVHRDVKPHNVLLMADGQAKLADFGIALLQDDSALRTTRTGMAMGSLAFMAPEQRLDARSVGPAADIYAVGTTLYNLLTTENPVDLFAARPESNRWDGIPEVLRPILQRATAYEPDERYPSARAMAEDLVEVLVGMGRVDARAPDPKDVLLFPRDAGMVELRGPVVATTATRRAITLLGAPEAEASLAPVEGFDTWLGGPEEIWGDEEFVRTRAEIEEGARQDLPRSPPTAVPSFTEVTEGVSAVVEELRTRQLSPIWGLVAAAGAITLVSMWLVWLPQGGSPVETRAGGGVADVPIAPVELAAVESAGEGVGVEEGVLPVDDGAAAGAGTDAEPAASLEPTRSTTRASSSGSTGSASAAKEAPTAPTLTDGGDEEAPVPEASAGAPWAGRWLESSTSGFGNGAQRTLLLGQSQAGPRVSVRTEVHLEDAPAKVVQTGGTLQVESRQGGASLVVVVDRARYTLGWSEVTPDTLTGTLSIGGTEKPVFLVRD